MLTAEDGLKGEFAWALTGLGFVALHHGDAGRAGQLFQEAFAIRKTERNRRGLAICLIGLASVARMRGDTTRALQAFGAIEAAVSVDPRLLLPADRNELERSLEAARAATGQETAAHLWGEGSRLTLEEALTAFPATGFADIGSTTSRFQRT
jgi:hypothetical protein